MQRTCCAPEARQWPTQVASPAYRVVAHISLTFQLGYDVVTDRVGNLERWGVLEVSRDTRDAYARGFPYERVLYRK